MASPVSARRITWCNIAACSLLGHLGTFQRILHHPLHCKPPAMSEYILHCQNTYMDSCQLLQPINDYYSVAAYHCRLISSLALSSSSRDRWNITAHDKLLRALAILSPHFSYDLRLHISTQTSRCSYKNDTSILCNVNGNVL